MTIFYQYKMSPLCFTTKYFSHFLLLIVFKNSLWCAWQTDSRPGWWWRGPPVCGAPLRLPPAGPSSDTDSSAGDQTPPVRGCWSSCSAWVCLRLALVPGVTVGSSGAGKSECLCLHLCFSCWWKEIQFLFK